MPQRRSPTYELVVPAVVRSLHEARAFVDRLARAAGLSDADREAFDLAVTEAVSNAIRHGSPRRGADQVLLTVIDEPEHLVVLVRDYGVGYEPAADDFLLPDPQSFADHGRGIYLIHALMDAVAYSNEGGTTVRMTKKKGANTESRSKGQRHAEESDS